MLNSSIRQYHQFRYFLSFLNSLPKILIIVIEIDCKSLNILSNPLDDTDKGQYSYLKEEFCMTPFLDVPIWEHWALPYIMIPHYQNYSEYIHFEFFEPTDL